MPIIPTVLETTSRGERGWDIYSRLLRERIVFLGTPIDDEIANTIIAQLLFLDAVEPGKEIMLYVNSPGGSVTAGLALYDTMHALQSPVSTVCLGQAASMAAILLATGASGKRLALPNARIMIHQPHMQGASGQATDLNILAQEILRLKQTTTEILARHTGQSVEKLLADMERDRYLSAPEAVEYGLIDRVLPPTSERLKAAA